VLTAKTAETNLTLGCQNCYVKSLATRTLCTKVLGANLK